MKRPGILLGIAGAAFVLFLITGVPASLITKLAPAELQVSNPQGSLWSGQASAIRFGNVSLGRTSWKLQPLRLLLGSLAGEIDATLPGGFARGNFSLGLGGSIALSDFSAASPLASLAASLGTALPLSQGQLTLGEARGKGRRQRGLRRARDWISSSTGDRAAICAVRVVF